jgi:hypothetical protein
MSTTVFLLSASATVFFLPTSTTCPPHPDKLPPLALPLKASMFAGTAASNDPNNPNSATMSKFEGGGIPTWKSEGGGSHDKIPSLLHTRGNFFRNKISSLLHTRGNFCKIAAHHGAAATREGSFPTPAVFLVLPHSSSPFRLRRYANTTASPTSISRANPQPPPPEQLRRAVRGGLNDFASSGPRGARDGICQARPRQEAPIA